MTDHELMQLSEIVGLALKQRGATMTTAESCTGGWVAKAITDIAGSSAWFERGFVTYSNEAHPECFFLLTFSIFEVFIQVFAQRFLGLFKQCVRFTRDAFHGPFHLGVDLFLAGGYIIDIAKQAVDLIL